MDDRDEFEVASGWPGMLAFWGGLLAQTVAFIVLAVVAGVTTQSPGVAIAAFAIEATFYFLIDVTYVFSVEMRMNTFFYRMSGHPMPSLHRMPFLGLFFVYATAANTIVIVLPALDASSPDYSKVALDGFVMGAFAYANLALVQAWSYKQFPFELVGMLPLSGGVLSASSSLLTVLICDQF